MKDEGLIWEKEKNQRACCNLIGDEIENKLRKKGENWLKLENWKHRNRKEKGTKWKDQSKISMIKIEKTQFQLRKKNSTVSY